MTKGTQWIIKTPRLKCRCGTVLHFECKGRWRIVYDTEPSIPSSSTLSISLDNAEPPPDLEEERT